LNKWQPECRLDRYGGEDVMVIEELDKEPDQISETIEALVIVGW
jgi:hypothetical protein